MKLKNIRNIAIGLVAILFTLIQSGCEQDWQKDLESSTVAAANVATVTLTDVADSALVIDYSLSTVGRIFISLVPGTSESVVPSEQDIIGIKVEGAVYGIQIILDDASNLSGSISISELNPYSPFIAYAVGHNLDGVVSEIGISNAVMTSDYAIPEITGFSPAGGADGVEISEDIVITFHENVSYVSGKVLTLTSDIAGYNEVVDEADIAVNGNVVTITHSDFPYSDYINLEMEAGAFVDASGNECEAIVLWPATPNYWFETRPEIDFTDLVGGFFVSSENEIGFGNGESGGYFVNIEQEDAYTLRIRNLTFDGAELFITLDPSDNTISVATQVVDYHSGLAEDIMASDTDPFGVGAGSGYVPGTFNPETGELSFYAYYYVSVGQFGFYTYDLVKVDDPSKDGSYGPGTRVLKVREY